VSCPVAEVEFNIDAVGILHEDLARRVVGHLITLKRDAFAVEARAHGVVTLNRKSDVIDRAFACARRVGDADMDQRCIAGIEPGAGAVEGRAITFLEAKDAAVERAAPVEIGSADIDVVDAVNGHGGISLFAQFQAV